MEVPPNHPQIRPFSYCNPWCLGHSTKPPHLWLQIPRSACPILSGDATKGHRIVSFLRNCQGPGIVWCQGHSSTPRILSFYMFLLPGAGLPRIRQGLKGLLDPGKSRGRSGTLPCWEIRWVWFPEGKSLNLQPQQVLTGQGKRFDQRDDEGTFGHSSRIGTWWHYEILFSVPLKIPKSPLANKAAWENKL